MRRVSCNMWSYLDVIRIWRDEQRDLTKERGLSPNEYIVKLIQSFFSLTDPCRFTLSIFTRRGDSFSGPMWAKGMRRIFGDANKMESRVPKDKQQDERSEIEVNKLSFRRNEKEELLLSVTQTKII